MDQTTIFWMVTLGLFWFWLLIPSYLLRRAIHQVIGAFQRHQSFCYSNPKSTEELGLPSLLQPIRIFRDYKLYALQLLMRAGIVQNTEEGKFCLRQEKLAEFGGRI